MTEHLQPKSQTGPPGIVPVLLISHSDRSRPARALIMIIMLGLHAHVSDKEKTCSRNQKPKLLGLYWHEELQNKSPYWLWARKLHRDHNDITPSLKVARPWNTLHFQVAKLWTEERIEDALHNPVVFSLPAEGRDHLQKETKSLKVQSFHQVDILLWYSLPSAFRMLKLTPCSPHNELEFRVRRDTRQLPWVTQIRGFCLGRNR